MTEPAISSLHSQLEATILQHPTFRHIFNVFSAIEQHNGLLPTADLPFVELSLLEMEHQQALKITKKDKLTAAIAKLEAIVDCVEEQTEAVQSKLTWVRNQTTQIEKSRDEIESEIEILGSCRKGRGKSEYGRGEKYVGSSQEELKAFLENYGCRQFPRNKTEVLMLINQVEAKIQQLQMQKAASFQYDL